MQIENSSILDSRFRNLLIEKRGEVSRGAVARKLSTIVGRTIPKTTYTGYELNRNPPRDVLVGIVKLYNLELEQVLGTNHL
jgi:hypothetical protein